MKRSIFFACLVALSSQSIESAVSFRGKSSFIHIADGQLVLNNPLTGVKGSIVRDAAGVISGQSIAFAGGMFHDEGNDLLVSAVYNPNGFLTLNGNSSLEGDGGTIQQDIHVSGTGNTIEGFFILQSDITFQDSSTTLSVAVQSAINKNIVVNGGTIFLEDNAHFADQMAFTGSGDIYSNGFSVHFNGGDFEFTGSLEWQDNAFIYLNSKTDFSGTWTFHDVCVINGQGNALEFVDDGNFVVSAGALLILKDVAVHGIKQGSIVLVDDSSRLQCERVEWCQHEDVAWDVGAIAFVGANEFNGSYTFSYESAQTSTIHDDASLIISGGLTFKIGRYGSITGSDALSFESERAILGIDESTLLLSDYGMEFTKGTLQFFGHSFLDITGTTTTTGLIVGNGLEDDDFTIEFSTGVYLEFPRGCFIYNNYGTDGIKAASKTSTIIRYPNSIVHVAQNWIMPLWMVRDAPGDEPGFAIAVGKWLRYNNTGLDYTGIRLDISATLLDTSVLMMNGQDFIQIAQGIFLLYAIINGADNQMRGTGDIAGSIELNDSSAQLSFNLQGKLAANVTMNDGIITLNNDLRLTEGAVFVGTGTVELNANTMYLGAQDSVWTSTIDWVGANATIELNANADLSSTWTFHGDCTINGNGNTLDLGLTGRLVIEKNTTLTLRNLHFKNISDIPVDCIDDTSRLVLDNMFWLQDDDVTFLTGSIQFVNSVQFLGTHTFSYESAQTSTIAQASEWVINDGMMLNIGRKTSPDDIEPLAFVDATSVIEIDGGILRIAEYGVNFTKGKLVFSRHCVLDITGTTTDTGFVIGNGLEADDFTAVFNAGVFLDFLRGFFVYNNYVSDGVKAVYKNSVILRYADSKAYVASDWVMPSWLLRVAPGLPPYTELAPGTSLRYNDAGLSFPGVEMDISASQLDSITFVLQGDDFIYLTKGTLESPTLVDSTGNEFRGNGDIAGDIILTDSLSQIIFDMQGRLMADVAVNGGAISLTSDLKLSAGAVFTGTGSIDLGSSSIHLGTHDSAWTSTLIWNGTDATVELGAHTDLSSTWTFSGNCTINGNNNVLDLGQTGCLVVDQDSVLTLRGVHFKNVSDLPVQCVDDSARVVLDNMNWLQDGDVTFSLGSIQFMNSVNFIGTHTFIYESSQTSTIDQISQWSIQDGMTLKIGRKTASNFVEPLAFTDQTSVLKCDSGTLWVSEYGAQFTKGILAFSGNSTLDIVATQTSYGFITGNGVSNDDFTVQLEAGCAMHWRHGFYVYNNAGVDGVKSASKVASIIRYEDSMAYIARNWVLPSFTLQVAPGNPALTEVAPGVYFGYDDTTLIFPDAEMILTSYQSDSITFLLAGDGDYIFLAKGSFLMPLVVSGLNNEIRGTGKITGPIFLLDGSSKLLFDLQGQVQTNISLGGGTMCLVGDLAFSDGAICTGTGVIDIQENTLSLGAKDSVWTSTLEWQGDNGTIVLNAGVDLLGTWTFIGTCIINGDGNALDLNNLGRMVIGSDTTLILRNVYLKNISDDSITCVDDSAHLVLDNTVWIQGGDATFEFGSITFLNEVEFIGSHTFAYESSQTSTIATKSTWSIRDGITLKDGRSSPSGVSPLYFEDSTSILEIDNASLLVSNYGMQIINGMLFFNRNVTIEMVSTSTENGLELGNGVTENDPVLQVNPGAVVNFASGHFTYNITNSRNLKSNTNTARVARGPDSVFYIKESLVLPEITVRPSPDAIMLVAPGKTVSYDNCLITSNQVEFSLIGSRYSDVANALSGDGLIFITRGTLPLATMVSGTGNRLVGSGGVSGPIILSDDASELRCGIEGALSANITLNEGTIILERNLYLAQGAILDGEGTMTTGPYTIIIGSDASWTSTIAWVGTDATVELGGNIDLSGTWTFSGQNTISAYGSTLDLSGGGALVVDTDSQLTIRDARISGLHDANIRCVDDTGAITFDNVFLVLDDDFTFSIGSMAFKDLVGIIGDGFVFAYQSQETSTILPNSTLRLDDGVTFSYDPAFNDSQDLLCLYDRTAKLELLGTTLHITDTGMRITTGQIHVRRDSDVYASGDYGLIFGDDTAPHDVIVSIDSGIALNIRQGTLQYRNVSTASMFMGNYVSRIALHPSSNFYLYETIDLGTGSLEFYDNTVLARVPGTSIIGSVSIFGSVIYASL